MILLLRWGWSFRPAQGAPPEEPPATGVCVPGLSHFEGVPLLPLHDGLHKHNWLPSV